MSPALLRQRESLIHGRVITHNNPGEAVFRQNLSQRTGILPTTKDQHTRLLGQKRPNRILTPACFVGMHHGTDRQQLAQRFKLIRPMTRQLIQQSVGLRLRKFELPEELQQGTHFVHRKTNDRHQKCDGHVNLKPELRQRLNSVDRALFAIGTAVDFIHNQNGFAISNSPHRSINRRCALRPIEAFRKNQLMDTGPVDLFVGRLPTATLRGLLVTMRTMRLRLAGFLFFFLLPSLLISLHRIRLIQSRSGILLLQINNPSLQLQNLRTQLDNDCCQLRVTRSFCSSAHETRCITQLISTIPRFSRQNGRLRLQKFF